MIADGTPRGLVQRVVALAAAGVEGQAVSSACRELGADATPTAVADLLASRHRVRAQSPAVAARLAALGAQTMVAGQPGFPTRLATAWPDLGAPLWVFVRAPGGRLPEVPTVAVVGTRRATLDGLATARLIAATVARAGAAVVSGLARGIDQAAHEACLEAGGRTIAVLGTGFGVDYPAGAGDLRRAIADSGGLVSELPPGTPPRPHRFLQRNRIIAGLADAVVVVEGGRQSGALTTARSALEQGREVLACPGSLHSPQAAASLQLIRDGARVVTEPDDVLDALGVLGLTSEPSAEARSDVALAPTDPVVAALLDLLGPTPATVDALARATGQPARVVLGGVSELVAAGLAHRGVAGVVRVVPGEGGIG